MGKHIYLDNNATTFVAKEVMNKIKDQNIEANASSMHELGLIAEKAVDTARNSVARLLNADVSEIIFTSGATESNNTVFSLPQKGRILTTTIEHPSIIENVKYLKRIGRPITQINVDHKGRVRLDELETELKKGDVSLVSVMAANNEVGTIQPFEEVSKLAHKYGALFHTDATQAIGKVKIDVKAQGIDYLSLSGHKFYAPKGCGVLYVKNGVPFEPFMKGGHQENGRRAGTYNTFAISGLGYAADMVSRDMDVENIRLWKLREKLRLGIEKNIDDIVINGDHEHCLSGTLNVSFPRAEGESILLLLDNEGIEVSTGSACATGSLEPSYVLLACGVPIENAHGSIRFSLGRYNTEEDIDKVIEVLPPIIKKLRGLSTRR